MCDSRNVESFIRHGDGDQNGMPPVPGCPELLDVLERQVGVFACGDEAGIAAFLEPVGVLPGLRDIGRDDQEF